MDNFHIEIVAEGDATLAAAIEIAFRHNAPGGKATFYRVVKLKKVTRYFARECQPEQVNVDRIEKPAHIRVSHSNEWRHAADGTPTLILLWSKEDKPDVLPLAFPMAPAHAIDFVKGWLENAASAGPQPDHDGDNHLWYCLFTTGWGHVADSTYAIIGVQAAWAMYGK